MKIFEGKSEAERKKLIVVMILAPLALVTMLYMLFGGGGKSSSSRATTNSPRNRAVRGVNPSPTIANIKPDDVRANEMPRPVVYERIAFEDTGIGRNIFAYSNYAVVAPSSGARASNTNLNAIVAPVEPTPPPEPPAALILAGLSPSTVYANSGGFQLQATGDKFTPETRIYFNNQELETQFVSPQLVKANVPSGLVAASGGRAIVVRTPDNSLFSNQVEFNVAAPPVPQYQFVGLVGGTRRRPETVVLKPRAGSGKDNELLNVQRGDIIGGRFRITAISPRAIEVVDRELNIKHSLPFVEQPGANSAFGNNPQSQPPNKNADSEDDVEDEEVEEPPR